MAGTGAGVMILSGSDGLLASGSSCWPGAGGGGSWPKPTAVPPLFCWVLNREVRLPLPQPEVGTTFWLRHPRLGEGRVGVLEARNGALILLSLDFLRGRGGGRSIEPNSMGGTCIGLGLIVASMVAEYWRFLKSSGTAGLSGLTCRSTSLSEATSLLYVAR